MQTRSSKSSWKERRWLGRFTQAGWPRPSRQQRRVRRSGAAAGFSTRQPGRLAGCTGWLSGLHAGTHPSRAQRHPERSDHARKLGHAGGKPHATHRATGRRLQPHQRTHQAAAGQQPGAGSRRVPSTSSLHARGLLPLQSRGVRHARSATWFTQSSGTTKVGAACSLHHSLHCADSSTNHKMCSPSHACCAQPPPTHHPCVPG